MESKLTKLLLMLLEGAQDIIFDVLFRPLLLMLYRLLGVIPGGGILVRLLDHWFARTSDLWPPSEAGAAAQKAVTPKPAPGAARPSGNATLLSKAHSTKKKG